MEKKKYSPSMILAVVFCAIGCLLLASPLFIESELNLQTIGLAVNGIGIFIYLFAQKAGKS
ncbi:MAG: hypothetical protein AAF927_15880 [Bacteroidota bacterium]